MKKTIFSVLVVAAAFLMVACNENYSTNDIAQSEVLSRIADQSAPYIIDVRSAEEYKQGHIPGAINLPHNRISDLPEQLKITKDTELVVYCESGRRASSVIKTLEKKGFYEVRHLQGDMKAWRKAGLLTE